MQNQSDLTPLMRQYAAIKQQYPHALLLFQVGDFYELFFDDAKKAAAFLGIALTKRGKVNGDPIPLCGVPVHALDHYLTKLIKGGFKIAICDQLEEPKPGKVVERGVTKVLTPGTLTDSKLLDEKSASYLFSFFPSEDQWGLLFAELLTAQLFATVLPVQAQKSLESELIRFFPDEIVIPDNKIAKPFDTYFKQLGYCTSIIASEQNQLVDEWINSQFNSETQERVYKHQSLHHALSHFYSFIRHTQQNFAIEQFKNLHWYAPDDFLILDKATQSNLELVRNTYDNGSKHTLFSVLDGAITPMGSRMIKKWVMRPLVKKEPITQRHEVVAQLLDNILVIQELEQILCEFGDLERIVGRIALHRALIHDFIHLKRVLYSMPALISCIAYDDQSALLRAIAANIHDFSVLKNFLEACLYEDASKEWIIKPGFDQELDRLRDLSNNGAQKIMELESQEQQATRINSLKIRYNNVQGYYIEITKTHTDAIPDRYIRVQTLVGRERYTTPELQKLHHEIMHAQLQVEGLEKTIFEQVKKEVNFYLGPLRKLAHAIATLDALLGLARVAYKNNYIRPTFNDNHEISIGEGRHPVVEQVIGHGFIPNDTRLDDAHSTWVITGPNMGGKSTYLRQVAQISIMAQIGSYVPAKQANLALIDRIFTRIGAADNLAHGKSTFLMEMEETAAICHQATAHSLVILDEVGRGTSTFDGLAIAQAVLEFIHTTVKARCLFATHYHELTLLADAHASIVNYHAASKKTSTGIQFLYKIMPGVASGSFGIEAAKLANLPGAVLARAETILHELQSSDGLKVFGSPDNLLLKEHELIHRQLELAQKKLAALAHIDYDNLSPKAAFDLLWKIRELS